MNARNEFGAESSDSEGFGGMGFDDFESMFASASDASTVDDEDTPSTSSLGEAGAAASPPPAQEVENFDDFDFEESAHEPEEFSFAAFDDSPALEVEETPVPKLEDDFSGFGDNDEFESLFASANNASVSDLPVVGTEEFVNDEVDDLLNLATQATKQFTPVIEPTIAEDDFTAMEDFDFELVEPARVVEESVLATPPVQEVPVVQDAAVEQPVVAPAPQQQVRPTTEPLATERLSPRRAARQESANSAAAQPAPQAQVSPPAEAQPAPQQTRVPTPDQEKVSTPSQPHPTPAKVPSTDGSLDLNNVRKVIETIDAIRGLGDNDAVKMANIYITGGAPATTNEELVLAAIECDRQLMKTTSALIEAKGQDKVDRAFAILALDDVTFVALGDLVKSSGDVGLPDDFAFTGDRLKYARALVDAIDQMNEESVNYVRATQIILSASE